MQPTPPIAGRRLKTLFYALYFVGTLGYVFYSAFSGTGLGGWLTALQIRFFGSASDSITVLGLFILAWLPLLLLLRYDPQGVDILTKQPRPPDGRPQGITFGLLARIAVALPLLAVPVYLWLQHQAEIDERRPVYPLNLVDNPNPPVPADAKFVHLNGAFQANYQYILTETTNGRPTKTDRYVPLTGAGWQPGEPVRFFLDTSTSYYYDPANQRSINLDQTAPFLGTFDGELGQGNLPTVVRQEFERQHLKLAESPYVLDFASSYGGHPPTAESHAYHLILWLGLGAGAAVLVGGGLGLALRRARGL